ncbi:MAG: hypothetical protein R6U26_02065 [Candidatus Undinarchaeales archaeon]
MAKAKIGRLMCFILFFLLVFSVSVSAEPQLVAASYQNFSAVDGKPAVTEEQEAVATETPEFELTQTMKYGILAVIIVIVVFAVGYFAYKEGYF